eukprot:5218860-Pleurochrysis_carterae.AAC.4
MLGFLEGECGESRLILTFFARERGESRLCRCRISGAGAPRKEGHGSFTRASRGTYCCVRSSNYIQPGKPPRSREHRGEVGWYHWAGLVEFSEDSCRNGCGRRVGCRGGPAARAPSAALVALTVAQHE